MNEKQYEELASKLDKITKLLSIIALKDKEKEQEKIELLDMMGFRTSEIARLLNKSQQNISTVLGNLRKKKESTQEPQATTEVQQPPKQEQTILPGEAK